MAPPVLFLFYLFILHIYTGLRLHPRVALLACPVLQSHEHEQHQQYVQHTDNRLYTIVASLQKIGTFSVEILTRNFSMKVV